MDEPLVTGGAPPTQDERVMAALAHVTVLIPMWGVVAPILIWVTQKDKSEFVAFQALQAMVYQVTLIAAWLIGMGCYTLSIFGTFLGAGASTLAPDTVGIPAAVAAFGLPFLVFGIMVFAALGFVAYGLYGAWQAFEGRSFRYALIGARVAAFMESSPRD